MVILEVQKARSELDLPMVNPQQERLSIDGDQLRRLSGHYTQVTTCIAPAGRGS